MSLPRFAGWGALGGLLISGGLVWAAGPTGEFVVLGPVFALSGAISAAGTLALARKAEGSLDASSRAHEPRLSEGESQKPLGKRR